MCLCAWPEAWAGTGSAWAAAAAAVTAVAGKPGAELQPAAGTAAYLLANWPWIDHSMPDQITLLQQKVTWSVKVCIKTHQTELSL